MSENKKRKLQPSQQPQRLGRLLPSPDPTYKFHPKDLEIIKSILSTKKDVYIYVPSTNALKVEAAKTGVVQLVTDLMGVVTDYKISVSGIECSSGVDEQPHGFEITDRGAKTRLLNLKQSVPPSVKDEVVFLVSMENGMIQEEGGMWVDRCLVLVEFCQGNTCLAGWALSEGVEAPNEQVAMSEACGWTKTVGSFIATKYNCNAKDWHGVFTGKNRQSIMEQAIKTALGLPYSLPTPAKTNEFKSDTFHQYQSQNVDFFWPPEISEMLALEKKEKKGEKLTAKEEENIKMWRGIYSTIPQSSKFGADNKSLQNCLGIILTEDLIVAYEDNGVFHIVLAWAKQDSEYKDQGWVLPGKRDRAYSDKNPDISIEDANYQLVKKELEIGSENVDYHFILGYFDDRVREQRMRSSGFVSLVVLNKKPLLTPGKLIGVPMNVLISLVKREIKIPHIPQESESYGMARNHDSLILNILETTRFYTLMENLKIVQARCNQQRLLQRPPFPEFDAGHECIICTNLLVQAKIVCKNGHCICGGCVVQISNVCPVCRDSVLPEPISNLVLDQIILAHYPRQYKIRHQELTGQNPSTWENAEMFQGKFIQFQ